MEEPREVRCGPNLSSPTQPSVEPVQRATFGGRMVVICRICLSTRPRMISIHSPVPEYDQKTLYAMLLSVCLPLNQRETIQGFPEQICRNCQWKLLSAYDLYETTLASDEQLRAQKHLALVAKIPKNVQSSEAAKPTPSVPVPANVANDGLIRVKEETPDDGYEDEQQYGPGSSITDMDCSMPYGDTSGDMSTVSVHPDVSLLIGRTEQGEEEDTSMLLEETKPPIPDPLETFFAEHYQVDEISGGHVCGLCKREFPYKSQCRMHIVQKHNPAKPFKCDICFCTLTSHLRLVRHKVVAHGAGQIKREDIIEGQNDVTGELTYTCPICRKVFNSSVRFKRHKNVHVVHNRPFKCEVCLYRFATKPQLTQHAKVHETKPLSGLSPGGSETGEFACDRCEEIFTAKRALTMHLKKVHQVFRVPGGARPEERERSEYVCIICKATFARETVLNTHMKMHELLAAEKEKERRLDLERMVKQELQQQMHLTMPPLPPLSPEVIDRSACVLEPFTLGLVPVAKPGMPSTGTNNNNSSSINNNSPPGGAPADSGGTGGPSGLVQQSGAKRKIPMTPTTPHHSSDMAYVCPVCDMEFDERDVLKKHQKEQHARLQVGIVSSKAGDSISPNSGSSPQSKLMPRFTDMPGLKMRLMDSSVRSSKKRLLNDATAMNHTSEPLDHDELLDTDGGHITAGLMPVDDIPASVERRPTAGVTASIPGEEPSQFQCELCHKKFPYNCYLTMHMRKNHDKTKPFGCKVCHYRFGYRGTLLRHQLIHSSQRVQPGSHGSIIFKCRICSAKFLELKQLNVHLKTHRKQADEQDGNRQVQLIRCDECPQIFSDPEQLAAHMLKQHPKHHSTDDELYDRSDRLMPQQQQQQQQHTALLMSASSSALRDDSNLTGSSTLNDLKLNSEQSKDDTNEAFMNDNDLSVIKIEPNYD